MNLGHRHLDPLIPSDDPPLLILLHGFGANMNDLLSLGHAIDRRYRVVAADAPVDLGPLGMPGGRAWFNLFPTPEGIDFDRDEAAAAVSEASAFVRAAAAQWSPDRPVHVLGFSQGAMMTHAMVLADAAPIGVAMACSGRMIETLFTDEARARPSLAGRPIFVSHGTHDEVIPVSSGRAIRDWYAESAADVSYHEYPMGHGIAPECVADIQQFVAPHLEAPATTG